MKTLIVDDNFTNRLLLQEILKRYGAAHIAVNGREAVEAVRTALAAGEPYDLVCLDIMMPDTDGQTALREIRELERAEGTIFPQGTKIIMTTALCDEQNVMAALHNQCNSYLSKPIGKAKLLESLRSLDLI